ncbi:hypothetical protein DFH11DRAFT_1619835 [Phellopilus nigrolimitatus]|nr:hypothetical protein DFH11DRAFT_1619835 [Phellopilus nigrolimitatus]
MTISDSASAASPMTSSSQKHPEFSFSSGLVTFLVESTTFTVHRYYFLRDSDFFRDMFMLPPAPGKPSEGESEESPIVIPDLLRIGYEDLISSDEWASVLSVADKFQFEDVRKLAIARLSKCTLPVDMIILGHQYGIREFLVTGFTEIGKRDHALKADEIRRLDIEDIALIISKREQTEYLRQRLRSQASGLVKGNTHTTVGSLLTALDVEQYFSSRLPPIEKTSRPSFDPPSFMTIPYD